MKIILLGLSNVDVLKSILVKPWSRKSGHCFSLIEIRLMQKSLFHFSVRIKGELRSQS